MELSVYVSGGQGGWMGYPRALGARLKGRVQEAAPRRWQQRNDPGCRSNLARLERGGNGCSKRTGASLSRHSGLTQA